jgi:hypothetical protein
MGYWQTLFDPRFMWDTEWKQRRDIENTTETAQEAQDSSQRAHQRIQVLERNVHDLSVTVMALVELLADAKQLDAQELRARVEAAMIGERHAARQVAAAAVAPEIKPVTCIRCHKSVPAERTSLLPAGPVCDACMR